MYPQKAQQEYSFFDEPLHTIEELRKRTQERGGVELRRVSKAEQQRLYDWFEITITSLPDDEKESFFEQFLLEGFLDEDTAYGMFHTFSPEQKATATVFIGTVLEGHAFSPVFYAGWSSLSPEQKTDLKKKLTTRAKQGDFSAAILLAPFEDLNKVKLEVPLDGRPSTLLSCLAEDFTFSESLLQNLLDFYKHDCTEEWKQWDNVKGEDHYRRQTDFYQWREDRYHFPPKDPTLERTYVRTFIKTLLSSHAALLYEHIDELKDLHLLGEEEEEILFDFEKRNFFSLRLQTHEEKQRLAEIEKEKSMRNISDYDEIRLSEITKEQFAIQDQGKIRVAERIIPAFVTHSQKFGLEKNAWISKMLDENIPVLLFIDRLGMSKAEVRDALFIYSQNYGWDLPKLSDWADFYALIEFDKSTPSSPPVDLTGLCMAHLLEEIQNSGIYSYSARTAIREWETLKDLLPPQHTKRLLKAFQSSPSLWLINIPIALQEGYLSKEVLEKIATQDPETFLEMYRELLASSKQISSQEQNEASELSITHEIRNLAKKTFINFPQLFFRKKFINVLHDIFSEEEQKQLIEKSLSWPVAPYCVVTIFQQDTEEQYKDYLIPLFLEHPEVVCEISNVIPHQKKLIKMVGAERLFPVLIDHMKEIDLTHFIEESAEFLLFLSKNRKRMNAFLEIASKQQPSLLAHAISKARHPENNYDHDAIVNNMVKKSLRLHRNAQASVKSSQARLNKLNEEYQKTRNHALLQEIEYEKKKLYENKRNEKMARIDLLAKRKQLVDSLAGEKPRNFIPTEEEKKQLTEFADETFAHLLSILEKTPGAVFDQDILKLQDEALSPLIRRDLEQTLEARPNLLVLDAKTSEIILKAIGKEEFTRLALKHSRLLLFDVSSSQKNIQALGGLLEKEDLEHFRKENPFPDLGKEKLSEDFYQLAIKGVASSVFYPLFQKELERLAKQSFEIYGPYLNTTYFHNEAFLQPIRTIKLLEMCPQAKKQATEILAMENLQERQELIQAIELLVLYHYEDAVSFDVSQEPVKEIVQRIFDVLSGRFQAIFDLPEGTKLDSRYLTFKSVQALATYYQNTCKKEYGMMIAFQTFLPHVLEGTFDAWRAWGTSEEPQTKDKKETSLTSLKEQGLLPENITLEQYEAWLSEETGTLDEVLEWDVQDVRLGIHQILNQAIADGHATKEDLEFSGKELDEQLQTLLEPIQEIQQEFQSLKKKFAEARKAKKAGKPYEKTTEEDERNYKLLQSQSFSFFEQKGEEIKKLEAKRILTRLRFLTIEEIESDQLHVGKAVLPLKKALETLEEGLLEDHPDLSTDLQHIRQHIHKVRSQFVGKERISRSVLSLTDRIDLERYIYIGAEPVPSCQHFQSEGSLNQGLLSYITDPNVRIIQLENEYGVIQGRCVLRLLEDEQGNPQLFIERMYLSNPHVKVMEAMQRLAINKAKRMGVYVYSLETTMIEQERIIMEKPVTLRNKASRSGYIYTDSGGGKVKDGIFTVVTSEALASV